MHGDQRSPSNMDYDVALTRGTHCKPKCYQIWGFAVCLTLGNGSQKHDATGCKRRVSIVAYTLSESGQKRKSSERAHHVRFAPESGPTTRSWNYSHRRLFANAAIAASRVAS